MDKNLKRVLLLLLLLLLLSVSLSVYAGYFPKNYSRLGRFIKRKALWITVASFYRPDGPPFLSTKNSINTLGKM